MNLELTNNKISINERYKLLRSVTGKRPKNPWLKTW